MSGTCLLKEIFK